MNKYYYIITEANQEYNDEIYYFTEGGHAVTVFEGENAFQRATAQARELNIEKYKGLNLWEYGGDWDAGLFPGVYKEDGDSNYDYSLENPTEEQIKFLLIEFPFYYVQTVEG